MLLFHYMSLPLVLVVAGIQDPHLPSWGLETTFCTKTLSATSR